MSVMDLTRLGVLVGHLKAGPMVEVGAAWQAYFAEQFRQRVGWFRASTSCVFSRFVRSCRSMPSSFFRSSFAFFSRSFSSCRRLMSR
jgi:hypothetical protein